MRLRQANSGRGIESATGRTSKTVEELFKAFFVPLGLVFLALWALVSALSRARFRRAKRELPSFATQYRLHYQPSDGGIGKITGTREGYRIVVAPQESEMITIGLPRDLDLWARGESDAFMSVCRAIGIVPRYQATGFDFGDPILDQYFRTRGAHGEWAQHLAGSPQVVAALAKFVSTWRTKLAFCQISNAEITCTPKSGNQLRSYNRYISAEQLGWLLTDLLELTNALMDAVANAPKPDDDEPEYLELS